MGLPLSILALVVTVFAVFCIGFANAASERGGPGIPFWPTIMIGVSMSALFAALHYHLLHW